MNLVYSFRPLASLVIRYHAKFQRLFITEFCFFFRDYCIILLHMLNLCLSFGTMKAVKIDFLFFLSFKQYFSTVLRFSHEVSLFKVWGCFRLLTKWFFFWFIILIAMIIVWISIWVCDILIGRSLLHRKKGVANSLIQLEIRIWAGLSFHYWLLYTWWSKICYWEIWWMFCILDFLAQLHDVFIKILTLQEGQSLLRILSPLLKIFHY